MNRAKRLDTRLSFGFVCTDLPNGAECGKMNSLCASGYCGDGDICRDESERPGLGDPCSEDSDCGDDGACAREDAGPWADNVCCESGDKVWLSGQPSGRGYVCTDQPIGADCGNKNSVCASGYCDEDGLCAEAPGPGDPCSQDSDCGDDNERNCGGWTCLGDVCGLEEATYEASSVCCKSRKKNWTGGDFKYVCTGLENGSACVDKASLDSHLCESGSCVDGVCVDPSVDGEGLIGSVGTEGGMVGSVKCFADKDELQSAVDDYMNEDCSNNNDCDVAQTYGWPMNSWCVKDLTEMSFLFAGSSSVTPSLFNEDIFDWNTSAVTNMQSMFHNVASFNVDISLWDTSRVANMKNMFNGASSFNQDISSWDVSSVSDMEGMFFYATSFLTLTSHHGM